MADRRSARELATFLEPMAGGRIYEDLSGPAVYQLDPSWRSAVLCVGCGYIGLVLSIPKRPMTWRCSRCDRAVHLEPPLAVLLAGGPAPFHPRLNPARRLD